MRPLENTWSLGQGFEASKRLAGKNCHYNRLTIFKPRVLFFICKEKYLNFVQVSFVKVALI
jgi:hypothetical protein